MKELKCIKCGNKTQTDDEAINLLGDIGEFECIDCLLKNEDELGDRS